MLVHPIYPIVSRLVVPLLSIDVTLIFIPLITIRSRISAIFQLFPQLGVDPTPFLIWLLLESFEIVGLMDAQARLGLQAIALHLPRHSRLRPHPLATLGPETYLSPVRLEARDRLAKTTKLVRLGALVLVE